MATSQLPTIKRQEPAARALAVHELPGPASLSLAFARACPPSAQTLYRDPGDELCELAEIMLVASDDEVASERRRGDDGRVDRVGPSSAR